MENKIQLMSYVGNLETYESHKEYSKAEELIEKGLQEAKDLGDYMGELALRNEAMTYYKRRENAPKALENADAAVAIINNPALNTQQGKSTISMNAASIYAAFGKKDEALFLYVQAVELYESFFEKDDPRLANIYNNIALSMAKLSEYGAALELYEKALAIISFKSDGELEQALTHINIACMFQEQYQGTKPELIEERVNTVRHLLSKKDLVHDSYYATVCQKCAGALDYLGYKDLAQNYLNQAGVIFKEEARKAKKNY